MVLGRSKAANEIFDLEFKRVLESLDARLEAAGVSNSTRKFVKAIITHAKDYFDFCAKMKRTPQDPKALAEFFVKELFFIAALPQSEVVDCAVSLAAFVSDLLFKWELVAIGPFGAAVYGSIALINAIDVHHQCHNVVSELYVEKFKTEAPGAAEMRQVQQRITVLIP